MDLIEHNYKNNEQTHMRTTCFASHCVTLPLMLRICFTSLPAAALALSGRWAAPAGAESSLFSLFSGVFCAGCRLQHGSYHAAA